MMGAKGYKDIYNAKCVELEEAKAELRVERMFGEKLMEKYMELKMERQTTVTVNGASLLNSVQDQLGLALKGEG